MKTSAANQPSFNVVQYPSSAIGEIIKKGKQLEETLDKHGISNVKTSRIGQYLKVLEEFVANDADPKRRANLNWPLFHQALFEINRMSKVVETLLKQNSSSLWLPRIQMLVSGHFSPQTEKQNTTARDIQFELYVAAGCCNAGFEIEPKEPDILVHDFAGDFGIAAKRPKSRKTLEKNIRKGSNQIVASGMDGILAIDLSLIGNPKNEIGVVESREEIGNPVRKVVYDFMENDCATVRSSFVKLPNVFGIFVCASALFFIESEGRFSTSTCQVFRTLCDEPGLRHNQLGRFAMQFGKNE
jgi:hypothetical protein